MRNRLLFFIPLLTLSCYQVDRNCSDFKTGTFEFIYTVDGVEKKGTFVRTNDFNIDYYENEIDSASIRWINDCEFVLKKIHPKNKSEAKAIHMKILSTTKNSYVFEYQLAARDTYEKRRVEKGVAKKIK